MTKAELQAQVLALTASLKQLDAEHAALQARMDNAIVCYKDIQQQLVDAKKQPIRGEATGEYPFTDFRGRRYRVEGKTKVFPATH